MKVSKLIKLLKQILESFLDPSGGPMEASEISVPSGVDEAIKELSA